MGISKWSGLCMIALMAIAPCSAQHKFPLRSGEWVFTSPATGTDQTLFCLNDELWEKGLTQNPVCTIQELSVSGTGASYTMNCPAKAFQMKGQVTMSFDGMEHMTSNSVMEMTVNGKTTKMSIQGDYRWKGLTCSPNDVNMRAKTR
jgi:hypothetical protein